jgi:hypothetical protein
MSPREPPNPLYLLLLLAGLVFVVTATAYAVLPVLEQKAAEQGEPAPPSQFRDALKRDGWWWLLCEVGVVTALGVASMALDRLRSLQKERGGDLIAPDKRRGPST